MLDGKIKLTFLTSRDQSQRSFLRPNPPSPRLRTTSTKNIKQSVDFSTHQISAFTPQQGERIPTPQLKLQQ